MRPMHASILLVAFFFSISSAQVNPAYQCPCHEADCIMIGGSPCYTYTGPNCQGYYTEFGGVTGYFAWISNDCYCPYPSCQVQEDLCADITCPDRCDGNDVLSGGSCNPETGDCVYYRGYCENGCQAGECISSAPEIPLVNGDEICNFARGEGCSNSVDCTCASGYCCYGTPGCSSSNADVNHIDDKGCAPTSSFECGDGTCDVGLGENCASCPASTNDCACTQYEECSPSSSGADNYGCVGTPDDPCRDIECEEGCAVEYDRTSGTGKYFRQISKGCFDGECAYDYVECPGLCNPGTGRCDSTGATGCINDGTYVVSGSQASIIRQPDDPNGQPSRVSVSSGSTHCKGDIILTGPNDRVWIKYRSGMISYIGGQSAYRDGKYETNPIVYATGTVQINSPPGDPGAPTEGEQGIVTMVPIMLAPDIQHGSNYQGYQSNSDLTAFYRHWGSLEVQMPAEHLLNWMIGKQHSNVIYVIDADGVTGTVLEGQLDLIDVRNSQQASVAAGNDFSMPAEADSLSDGSTSTASVATGSDYVSQMPEEVSGGCCGTVAVILLVAGFAFASRGH